VTGSQGAETRNGWQGVSRSHFTNRVGKRLKVAGDASRLLVLLDAVDSIASQGCTAFFAKD
jgi:hypothetical protein